MVKEIFYHEDFYRQIELIPQENYFKTLKDIQDNESIESASEFGFLEIMERTEHKIGTEQLNINMESIKNELASFTIQFFPKVITGYGSTEWAKPNTIALGFERFALFFEFNNESIIKHIWICQSTILPNKTKCDNLINALFVLGHKYSLILIDWSEGIVVRLSSKKNIRQYLKTNFNFDYQEE